MIFIAIGLMNFWHVSKDKKEIKFSDQQLDAILNLKVKDNLH